jgi:hypothetical protein
MFEKVFDLIRNRNSSFGMSNDNSFKLKEIPKVYPKNLDDFCKVNADLNTFVVVNMDKDRDIIMLQEIATKNIITINSETYSLLFSEVKSMYSTEVK